MLLSCAPGKRSNTQSEEPSSIGARSTQSQSSEQQSAQAQRLDSLCSRHFPAGEPGAAVLVLSKGEVLFDRGYGLADLQSGSRIDGDTFFCIASVSKQFTAAAVLQLADKGLLSLEDEVRSYFPEFTSPIWKGIRIKHLLSHSSGIPDARKGLSLEQRIYGDEALATEYLKQLDYTHFPPGTDYEYVNPTYVLLGQLVERVSGEEFTKYVTENIFRPAGMSETLYFDRDHEERIPRMAHGYEYADVSDMPEERTASESSDEPKVWYEYDFGEETFFATRPDGGIYTSIHEFVKWEKALRTGALVREELLKDAWTPHTKVSGSTFSNYQNRPDTWYGYGWFLEPTPGRDGEMTIYHTGDTEGSRSSLPATRRARLWYSCLRTGPTGTDTRS